MRTPKTCPNCGEKFIKTEKIPYYRFSVVHRNPICPYKFEAAANTLTQLRLNLRALLENYGFLS